MSEGEYALEEMGSSVDVVGSSARAPILEVWRYDAEDGIIIPLLRCSIHQFIIFFYFIFFFGIYRSCPWRRGLLLPQVVKMRIVM